MSASPWSDLPTYVATQRLGGLVLSPDGRTLLVSVSAPNGDGTEYSSAWWWVDVDGTDPARRWTRSIEGDSAATFIADGSLLFTSKRPAPPVLPGDKEPTSTSVLWCLPAGGGEAYAVARRLGGWSGVAAARTSDRAVLAASAHRSSADEAEHARITRDREEHKVTAILHDGYPVRLWDHDLGVTDVRLLALDLAGSRDERGDLAPAPEAFTDVTPTRACTSGEIRRVSDDGRTALLDWTEADPRGVTRAVVAAVDVITGQAEVLARDDDDEFAAAVCSPDATLVVCRRETRSTAAQAPRQSLWAIDRSTGTAGPLAPDWDAWPTPLAVAPDRRTVYVTIDERGNAPLYAVDVATGERRRLTGGGAIVSAVLSPDGTSLYAVRTSYTDPGTLIAIDTATGGVRELRSPVSFPTLPGRCEDVTATADDGAELRGYLLLPGTHPSAEPAPLAVWIHGGPLSSWNSWSWRWCPWLLVSRGYAVLLPDPALSTGYGQDFIQRGWGGWGGAPYTDLMAITDAVVARPDVDERRTVAMGGSFGGYLANWVAGHTDRFRAIVTHASLWNLETFGPTTDAAWYWSREMSPEMMRENSPHHFADQITTPILVIHGDKDYRVPISEGLALWWALVSAHDGPPEDLPHKFLYFPDENHWVLTPQHARLWYETVFAFLDSHVYGKPFIRPPDL